VLEIPRAAVQSWHFVTLPASAAVGPASETGRAPRTSFCW
jgi:hypothetical protein